MNTRHKRPEKTFAVGSLFDSPGIYVAICNDYTGQIIGHRNLADYDEQFQNLNQVEPEPEKEQVNENQLLIFT